MRQQRHWRKAAFITELQQASLARSNELRSWHSHIVPANHLWKEHLDKTVWATWLPDILAEGSHFCCPLHGGSANQHWAAGAQAGLRLISHRRNGSSFPVRNWFLRLLLKPSTTQFKIRKAWRLSYQQEYGLACLLFFFFKEIPLHSVQPSLKIAEPCVVAGKQIKRKYYFISFQISSIIS